MAQYDLPRAKPRIELKNPPVVQSNAAAVPPPVQVPRAADVQITPELLAVIRQIESGGNPNAVTGSYKGLYQLSDSEFARLGGRGSIFNPEENARIAQLKLGQEAAQVAAKLGRPLTPGEIYLVHQQGVGGAYEHITNPGRPAWQSMHATGEGRSKGSGWAQKAIWGNVPDRFKPQFGNVHNITSGDFVKMWSDRVARGGGGKAQAKEATDEAPKKAATVSSPLDDPAGNTAEPETKASTDTASSSGGIGSDAVASERASREPEKPKEKEKDYREIAGDALADLGKTFSDGPVARNARTPSSPANVAMASLPPPPPPQPIADPRMVEAQRQQLAMAMKRLNSGRLV